MVDETIIAAAIDARMKRILDIAKLAAPPEKEKLLGKLIMDELGWSGLRGDLAELLGHGSQGGMDRHGQGR